MDVNLVEMQHFLAVVRAGSLSGAARLLSVTQPTVGRYISAMEARLDRKLFDRRKEGMILTEAGKSILPHAQDVESAIQAFERRVVTTSSHMAGVVRISTTEGLGSLWITPKLYGVLGKFSSLTFELIVDNQIRDLAKREADIAVRLVQPAATGLTATRVGTMSLQLLASRSYVDRFGMPYVVEDFSRHRLVSAHIRRAPGDSYWQRILNTNAHVAMACNSSISQVEAVRRGIGISVLPSYIGRKYEDLVAIMPGWRWHPREIWLATHIDLARHPRVRGAMDALTEIFDREKSDLEDLFE